LLLKKSTDRLRSAGETHRTTPFQVFVRKLSLASNEILEEACQTIAVGVIVPLKIEDWEAGDAIEPEPCTDHTISQ
jgi:hypothetical protein